MTDLSSYSLNQLAQILSALENAQRNPNSKPTALKAIGRHAETLGCTVENILEAAAGLLDGRMNAGDFRAALHDAADADATAAEAPTGAPEAGPANEPATDEPAAATAPEGGTGGATEIQPEARISVKEQLLAACRAAERVLHEHEIEADTLQMLRAAIARAQGQPRRATTGGSAKPPRADSKQARLIAMLQRGASISDMTRELGWLRHTCHGALAGLKKKRGLQIVSDKHAGGERIYRLAAPVEESGNAA
jgi:Protein of unknown function (DUF3489)